MRRYWFTGDLHLGHSNILHICNRPFATIEEHDRTLINNHNSLVGDNDVTFNLGDISYRSDPSYVVKILKQLKGKLVVILGNHDRSLRGVLERGLLDKELNSGKIEILGGRVAIDHTISISKMLEFSGQKIFISHYGHRTWPNAFRGCIHLYAHSHDNLKPLYKSMDIGVDAVPNKYHPISLEEVIRIMNLSNEPFSEK